MDVFQRWVDLWNPIVEPKASLTEEAARKYQAGEISQEEYFRLIDVDAQLEAGKVQAQQDYETAVREKYGFNVVLGDITKTSKNLVAVGMLILAFLVVREFNRA